MENGERWRREEEEEGKKWEGVFIVGEEKTHTNWGFLYNALFTSQLVPRKLGLGVPRESNVLNLVISKT